MPTAALSSCDRWTVAGETSWHTLCMQHHANRHQPLIKHAVAVLKQLALAISGSAWGLIAAKYSCYWQSWTWLLQGAEKPLHGTVLTHDSMLALTLSPACCSCRSMAASTEPPTAPAAMLPAAAGSPGSCNSCSMCSSTLSTSSLDRPRAAKPQSLVLRASWLPTPPASCSVLV